MRGLHRVGLAAAGLMASWAWVALATAPSPAGWLGPLPERRAVHLPGRDTLQPPTDSTRPPHARSPACRLLLEPWHSYRARYRARYTHRGAGVASVTIQVPLPTQDERQRVSNVRVRPTPQRRWRDAEGNLLAEATFRTVLPGRPVEVQVEAQVVTRHLVVEVDARQAQAAGLPLQVRQQGMAANPELPCELPAARSVAAGVVAREPLPWYRVLRLYDWVRSLQFVASPRPRTVPQALSARQVQCSDAALLLVTLCRAAGVPARYVGGLFAFEDASAPPGAHAWAEVWLAPCGWVPLDPTMGRFDEAARLARLGQLVPAYLRLWQGTSRAFTAQARHGAGHGKGTLEVLCSTSALQVSPRPSIQPAARFHGQGAGHLAQGGNLASSPSRLRLCLPSTVTAGPQAARGVVPLASDTPSSWSEQDRGFAGGGGLQDRAARLRAAGFWLRAGQLRRALDALEDELACEPRDAQAWQMLRDALVVRELWPAVGEVGRAAARQLPRDAAWVMAWAQAAMRQQRYAEAREGFTAALQLLPEDGWLHAMRGWCLEALGDRAGARREIEHGLRLGIAGSEKAFFEQKQRGLRSAHRP